MKVARVFPSWAWLMVVMLLAPRIADSKPGQDVRSTRDIEQERIAGALGFRDPVTIGETTLLLPDGVRRFYLGRGYRRAWITEKGLRLGGHAVRDAVATASTQGLDGRIYHLAAIDRYLATAQRAAAKGQALAPVDALALELLLTDAFLAYAGHMLGGRVNPVDLDPEWDAKRRDGDTVQLLRTSLGQSNVASTIRSLEPRAVGYRRLRQALARYRALTWPALPAGVLRSGSVGPAVAALRVRLATEGYGVMSGGTSPQYGADLQNAVRLFQASRGLPATGVVDAITRRHLNRPAAEIVQQIALNLERWRWLPLSLGEEHIVVNVPAFELAVRRGDADELTMRVVVGKEYRRTPVFSSHITQVVFHPYWNIPRKIALEDKLPKIQRDIRYLARNHIIVLSTDGKSTVIDPTTIDWKSLSDATFPYRLRQDPGAKNALGAVKLEMPNRHAVYLHDTPDRSLFAHPRRAYSSGCIRIEHPNKLAALLLEWKDDRVQQSLAQIVHTRLPVKKRIPVHLLYWTAWVEKSGQLQLRDDIYQRDAALERALEKMHGAR